MQNILVVKLSAIGDVIHALPVSYAIKETFPDAHLTWVVEPPAYDLLTMNPYVDEIIIFHKKEFKSIGGFLKNYGPLKHQIQQRMASASFARFAGGTVSWKRSKDSKFFNAALFQQEQPC